MPSQRLKLFKVFASGPSLRRRVAYSLAIVRLILVPVIFLAVYYLFVMWGIVDRIVSVDAAVAMEAEQASIQMLDARRSERAYFLLHDPADLRENRGDMTRLEKTIRNCARLNPHQEKITTRILTLAGQYRTDMQAVAEMRAEAPASAQERIQEAARKYEIDLAALLRRGRRLSRSNFVLQLHNLTQTFNSSVTAAGTEDPAVQKTAEKLRASSGEILRLASRLEGQSWAQVQQDHQKARNLLDRSEWVLGSVSLFVFLLSIWVSFTLPRQVVKPLVDLKDAVDHAAAGNYEIVFNLQGEGEIVQLANSVRKLIAHVREKSREVEASPDASDRAP